MAETTTVTEYSDPVGGYQRLLCGAAIALFVFFVLSRSLDWATFHVAAPDAAHAASSRSIGISGKSAWHALSTPLLLCGLALIPINLFFIFSHDGIDPLTPAIANCLVALVLAGTTLYFIASTNKILGSSSGRSVSLTYKAANGATAALLIALFLLLVGAVQMVIRLRE